MVKRIRLNDTAATAITNQTDRNVGWFWIWLEVILEKRRHMCVCQFGSYHTVWKFSFRFFNIWWRYFRTKANTNEISRSGCYGCCYWRVVVVRLRVFDCITMLYRFALVFDDDLFSHSIALNLRPGLSCVAKGGTISHLATGKNEQLLVCFSLPLYSFICICIFKSAKNGHVQNQTFGYVLCGCCYETCNIVTNVCSCYNVIN